MSEFCRNADLQRIMDSMGKVIISENLGKRHFSVDFDHPELYNQTYPLTCNIQGKNININKPSWARLLVNITEHYIKEKNSNLIKLSKTPLYGKRVFFMPKKPFSGASILLSNGMWLYVGYNPRDIVLIVKSLCHHCGEDLNDVIITYEKKEGYAVTPKDKTVVRKNKKTKIKNSINEHSTFFTGSYSQIDEGIRAEVVSILEEYFPNGMRPTSVIDINKFRKFYIDKTGNDLHEIGIEIESLLEASGIPHGEKIYVIPATGKLRLTDLINKLLVEGHRLFYYKEFYKVYLELMQKMNIFTPDLLRTVLRNTPFPFYYYKHYCVTDREINGGSEILRCYETNSTLSWEEAKVKLPFLPLSKIKHTVVYNDNFLKVRKGVFAHISTVVINDNDIYKARKIIENEILQHGFASLAMIDVSASLELNLCLSEYAVKNGLFQIFFSKDYEKRGNIIMKKGKVPKSTVILENFCLSKNVIKRKDMAYFEKEIRGHYSLKSIEVALDKMIRINKNTFVADKLITFDIDAVDNALELFVTDNVIPLRSVASFTTFPYIEGYSWNLFLIESYCRRFSRKFAFTSRLPNSKNIGAIYRKNENLSDIIDILANAVFVSAVPLTEKTVGDFLVNNHYIGKSNEIVLKIIEKVYKLKEKGI